MEAAAQPLPRRRTLSLPAARLSILVLGALAVLCALLGQHPADPTLPGAPIVGNLQTWLDERWDQSSLLGAPAWVILSSLAAIAGAAIALPGAVADCEVQQGGSEAFRRLAIGAGLIGVPCLVAAAIWAREPFAAYHLFTTAAASWAALLWLGGIVAGLAYLWPRASLRAWWPIPRSRAIRLLLEGIALLLILDLAAGLRLWHLGTLPEGIWFDEVDFAHSAQRLFSLPFQPLGPGSIGHTPSLYYYVMAMLLQVGGTSLATIRLTSALFGVLAVLAVYLVGRRMGGPALGLCAAALLAMAQWAIDFSRLGMSNIAAPALIALGFFALCRAMHRPHAAMFALSGVVLGLSLLTNPAGFLAGGIVALVVVAIRLAVNAPFRRRAWPGSLLLPLGLAAGALPLLIALLLDPGYTLAREQTVSIFNEYGGLGACLHEVPRYLHSLLPGAGSGAATPCMWGIQESAGKHLVMFSITGDNNGRHNLPGAPMLDAVTGACLLLGIGMCLRRLHHWFYLLLLLWFGASVLGGVLSLDWEAPQGDRTVGATAPLALIAALPLAALATSLWTAIRPHAARRLLPMPGGGEASIDIASLIATLATAVLVMVPLGDALALNHDGYFVRHAHDVPSWNEGGGRQTVMGEAAAALARQGYTVRISPALAGDPALTFAAGEMVFPAYDPNVPVPLEVQPPGLALIMTADDGDTLALVRHSYPDAPVINLTPNFDHTNVQAYAVLVRQQDIQQNLGVDVRFVAGSHTTSVSHVQGFAPWPAGSDLRSSATIRGTLLIDKNLMWQPLAIRVYGAVRATLTIDGQAWQDTAAGTGTIRLGAGNHDFVVQAEGKAASSLGLEWTAGNGTTMGTQLPWQPIPPLVLASPSLPTGGLLGLYFQRTDFSGPVALARVDQQVNAYFQNPPPNTQFPFSARWVGTLRADRAGLYTFNLNSTGPSVLYIDGKATYTGMPVTLSSGIHALRLDYVASGSYLHCYFTWQPPGQSGFTPVPPSVTEPAIGRGAAP